jgi:hypothetical protein
VDVAHRPAVAGRSAVASEVAAAAFDAASVAQIAEAVEGFDEENLTISAPVGFALREIVAPPLSVVAIIGLRWDVVVDFEVGDRLEHWEVIPLERVAVGVVDVVEEDAVDRVEGSGTWEVAFDWPGVDFGLTVGRIVLADPSVQVVGIGLGQVGWDMSGNLDWGLISVVGLVGSVVAVEPAVPAAVAAVAAAVAVVVAVVVAGQPIAIAAGFRHSVGR